MDKYTFKMKDRMKLVVEKHTNNSFALIVSGKDEVPFTFSKKSAADLVKKIGDTLIFSTSGEYVFRKTTKGNAGRVTIVQPDVMHEVYTLVVTCESKGGKEREVFNESGIHKKDIKKMLKVMREVFGIEERG